jgi:hypothetical protein
MLRLRPDYGRGPLGQVSKSSFLGFFIITMKFLIFFGRIDELATGAYDHGSNTKNILGVETFQSSSHMFNSENRNSGYAQKSIFS